MLRCWVCAGELKKVLAAQTGLHPEEQRIMYRNKERESTAFLDLCGVKEKSKLVLVEDLTSHERRCLEKRRAARLEKAAKLISEIGLEVDKLAVQVCALSHDNLFRVLNHELLIALV